MVGACRLDCYSVAKATLLVGFCNLRSSINFEVAPLVRAIVTTMIVRVTSFTLAIAKPEAAFAGSTRRSALSIGLASVFRDPRVCVFLFY